MEKLNIEIVLFKYASKVGIEKKNLPYFQVKRCHKLAWNYYLRWMKANKELTGREFTTQAKNVIYPLFHIYEVRTTNKFERNYHVMTNISDCTAYLDFIYKGELLTRYVLRSEAKDPNWSESQRKCIENFINHQYTVKVELHDPKGLDSNYTIDHSHTEYDFSDLNEPWKGLFEDIFLKSNWGIQKALTL